MNKKKNLIIYFSKLSIGGMERALIDFIRKSNLRNNYNITLYLGYVIEKSYLEEISKYVTVKIVCQGKWNLIGKIKAYLMMNIDCFRLKYNRNKYDCSICYTHHHKILSKLTRVASDNNIVFIHGDLKKSRTKEELDNLKKKVQFHKFKKVICVSNCVKESFMEIYPNYKGKVAVANNYINGEDIINKSKEKVDDYKFNKITFINIARHEDRIKQISFIIEASKKLKKAKYDFNVLLLGDGPDHQMYIDLVKKYKLNDTITLLGNRVNPYKYLAKADALLFTSNFEGYGIVLDEARVLGKPIITTPVADAKLIIDEGYGILCDNNIESVYKGMEQFIKKGFTNKKFDYKLFNDKITKTIDEIVKEG